MKIIRIWGGLGNQMYQYAFGKGLENYIGEEILSDINTLFPKKGNNVSKEKLNTQIRVLELTNFPKIRLPLARINQVNRVLGGSKSWYSKGKRALNRLFGLCIPVPDERDYWITDIINEKIHMVTMIGHG